MNDIEILEHIIKTYIDDEEWSKFVNPEGRFIKNKDIAQYLENLIKENKELKEKNEKLENEYINPSKAIFSYYDNTKGMKIVINGFTANLKIKDYLNKMEKRCNKPKFSVMKKDIEKLLEGE